MRILPLAVGAVALVAALVSVGLGWAEAAPDLEPDERQAWVDRAFADYPDAEPAGPIVEGSHTNAERRTFDTWDATVQLDRGTLTVQFTRDGAAAVNVIEEAADGSGEFLTPAEFDALDAFRYRPGADDLRTRNVVGTVAGLLLAAVGALAWSVGGRVLEQQQRTSEVSDEELAAATTDA